MRRFAWTLAVLVTMVVTRAAQAAPSCEWELQKADQSATTVTEGDVVVVTVTTPARGNMRAPVGWENRWMAQDACPGFPSGCGTWVSTKTVALGTNPGDRNDNGQATFTIENAGCANNARTFQLNVVAKPLPVAPPPPPDPNAAKISQQEWDEVKAAREAAVDFALGYSWIPNLSTMSRMAHGLQLQANGRVSKHASLGGELWWLTYGQPTWSELHPTSMDTTVNAFSAAFTAAGIVTAGSWLEWSLGGKVGVAAYHHPQEYIGAGRYIASDTKFVPWIAPMTKLALFPSSNFGFYGQFSLQIDLMARPTEAGTENIPATRAASPDPVGHVWPMFGSGIVVRLP